MTDSAVAGAGSSASGGAAVKLSQDEPATAAAATAAAAAQSRVVSETAARASGVMPAPTQQESKRPSRTVSESNATNTDDSKDNMRPPGNGGGGGKRNWRKRHRKRKVFHRRSRPYPKTSRDWDGEQDDADPSLDLNQEQERRADFVKMSMQKYGKPYAPYNTTQFLMEDHNVREPEFEEISKLLRLHQAQEDRDGAAAAENESFSTRDGSDSEDFFSSPDDEHEHFQQRQFSQVYEHVHAERLGAMSKKDLVQEYLLLEQKVEDLEQKLKTSQAAVQEQLRQAPSTQVESLRQQVKQLTEENERLRLPSSCSSAATAPDSCTSPEANAIPSSTSPSAT